MKTIIYPNLQDDSINELISESMFQKLGGLKRIGRHRLLFKKAGSGIPQGNPLSPLLSNIYLSNFDVQLKEAGLLLIRYADDFIVIFKSEEEAKNGYSKICAVLNDEFSLKIHPLEKNGKTEIVNPTENEFSFLSIKFDGINVYPGRDTVGYLKNRITKSIKEGELNSELHKVIHQSIEKWVAIYSYLDIERYFDGIDSYVAWQLTKKFGRKTFKTSKCQELAQKMRTRQFDKSPKSFWRNPALTSILPKFIRYRSYRVVDKENN